jgi:hypothetical protein
VVRRIPRPSPRTVGVGDVVALSSPLDAKGAFAEGWWWCMLCLWVGLVRCVRPCFFNMGRPASRAKVKKALQVPPHPSSITLLYRSLHPPNQTNTLIHTRQYKKNRRARDGAPRGRFGGGRDGVGFP